MKQVLLSYSFTGEETGSEYFSNLPKVTPVVSNRTRPNSRDHVLTIVLL